MFGAGASGLPEAAAAPLGQRDSGLPKAAAASDAAKLKKFNKMRHYLHPSRQRDGSSGSSGSQYLAQEKDGCVIGLGFSGSRGSSHDQRAQRWEDCRQQSQHDGRGSRKEEDNRASLCRLSSFKAAWMISAGRKVATRISAMVISDQVTMSSMCFHL